MKRAKPVERREEGESLTGAGAVLEYQSRKNHPGEVPSTPGRWIAGIAVAMFGVSFFLPAIDDIPGWVAMIWASLIWLQPDEWGSWVAAAVMIGAAANPMFVVAAIYLFRATTQQGRRLRRSLQPALGFSLGALIGSSTCIVSVAVTVESPAEFIFAFGWGAYLWVAAPGVLTVAAILAGRDR